jgi:hypothetical protein
MKKIKNVNIFGWTNHHITGLYMYAAKAARLRSARSWLRHSHASLRHSLATLQTYGLLIRVAKPSHTTGTLDAICPKIFKKYVDKNYKWIYNWNEDKSYYWFLCIKEDL